MSVIGFRLLQINHLVFTNNLQNNCWIHIVTRGQALQVFLQKVELLRWVTRNAVILIKMTGNFFNNNQKKNNARYSKNDIG